MEKTFLSISIFKKTSECDPVDVFFTFQDNKKPVSEIKVRAKKSQGYYTHLIELRKLMALENACM